MIADTARKSVLLRQLEHAWEELSCDPEHLEWIWGHDYPYTIVLACSGGWPDEMGAMFRALQKQLPNGYSKVTVWSRSAPLNEVRALFSRAMAAEEHHLNMES